MSEFRAGQQAGAAWARKVQAQVFDKATGARAHHQDAVGEEQRFVDIVGDEHHGGADAGPDIQQQLLHAGTGLRVQCAERFVHQQQPWAVDQHPGDFGPLLHTAGQLVGPAPGKVGQPHQLQHFTCLPVTFGPAQALHLQAEGHVVEHATPGQQGMVLEHHAALR
ncbi:hypothetical protein D3C76_1319330 [compost metagenome]